MKENWGQRGMPPRYYEVRHRAIDYESPTYQSETVWVEGYHPHLGKPIQGWSGQETVVHRDIIKGPSPGMEMLEGIEYPIIRYRR